MKAIALAILAVLFLAVILLARAARALPTRELRRRARGGKDKKYQAIYKIVAYEYSLALLLWTLGILSAAGIILIAATMAWWLILLAVIVLSELAIYGFGSGRSSGWAWSLAARVAPVAAKLLSWLQPGLSRLARRLKKRPAAAPHSRIYEREDLLELLDNQNRQLDNRLSEAELKIAHGALTFSDKTIGSVMVPRDKVKMVAASDSIGPLLMDELHSSGFTRFPVVKELTRGSKPEIIGVLYLKDLLDHAEKGKVRDCMKKRVYFINEAQNLPQGLAAFTSTEAQLLVVVNNFAEMVGVVTIEDVVQQITGASLVDEFEHYDDIRAVADQSKEDYLS